MTLNDYQIAAKRTCVSLGAPLEDNLHMVLGMCTESSELADVYKKALAYKKNIDLPNVVEELGDLLFYIVNFASFNNIDLEKVMTTNIAKLQKRYPKNFNIIDATNRDLNAERQILENEL